MRWGWKLNKKRLKGNDGALEGERNSKKNSYGACKFHLLEIFKSRTDRLGKRLKWTKHEGREKKTPAAGGEKRRDQVSLRR